MPSRWSFARRHMLDTGELMWISVKRVGTRRIKPLTGAVEYMRRLGMIRPRDPSWCPVTLSSEGRPLLAVSGSSWGPGRCVVACSLVACGRLPLRGYRGPGPVRASVLLSRVLVECRGHTCRTPPRACSVSSTILTIRKVPGWHISNVPGATEVAVRAVLVRSGSLGAAVQRRPRKYSEVTGALVAGRAVT